MSFVFPDTVTWDAVAATVRSLGISELQSAMPVEIFRDRAGKAIAAGHYSLLWRMIFQSGERTLTEEELAKWQEQIVAALTALGGVHRAS